MLRVPAPAEISGGTLLAELQAAGLPARELVYYPDDGEVEIAGLAAGSRTRAVAVIAAHKPPGPIAAVDVDAEFRAAVQAATTLAGLKAALLGTTGPGAQPRRPTA